MIFPFFKRVQKYKRFQFEPRYYDPVKEDLKIRTDRIKREIEKDPNSNFGADISSAFSRRERQTRRMSSMQLVLIGLFIGTFGAYIALGNAALWIFIVLFPVYIFIRTRKFFH